MFSLTFSTDVQ